MNLPLRILCLCLGWLMVGFAIAGVFLPILPTTPFLLLAAGLFARASPRLERWLVEHPIFGPSLRLWREKGAIGARAKFTAVALIAASFGLFLFSKPDAMLAAIVAAGMALPVAFILTRPSN
ncbi:YbaN family protein [Ensifer sp. IC4062]|nr:YbaN family protein [Ensifer sp. IC4062]MCA1441397.1 YbaN family protein [Ensifer sp. IC4062]